MSITSKFNKEEFPMDVTIPSGLLFNKNIDISAIKLYSIIKGLTRLKGFCFATNEYLSEATETSIATVQRHLRELKNEGFLEIETDKNGIYWQRRIYLGVNLKKCLRRVTGDTPPPHPRHPPTSSVTPIIEDKYNSSSSLYSEEECKKNVRSAHASILADFFLTKIKERNPEFKEPNKEKWADSFDRMLRLDKRDPERIKEIIEWASTHIWWKAACLSPDTLRKKYDEMLMQKMAGREKEVINKNRIFAKKLKDKYPKEMQGMSFDEKYVIYAKMGKELPFALPEETFQKALLEMFGGRV